MIYISEEIKKDFVFKRIFGSSNNKDILKDFLEGVLNKKIDEIEVKKDATLDKISKDNKTGTLDVQAKIDGKNVDIEMQVKDEFSMEKRSTFYASKLILRSLKAGESYDKLPELIMMLMSI